ncbi:MAG TPA: DUF1993 family protein [Usitatibacteraceae bacterium]
MTISMYQVSVPVFQRMLGNLKAILEKAAAYAQAKKIEDSVFLNSRLYPDMLQMSRQVQIAADFAKGACSRLAGQDVPKFEDNEKTFAELIARIDKTLAHIATFKTGQIDGQEERDITINVAGNPTAFKGQNYLLHQVLPNFYFHVTAAYAILRHNGLEIGKRDFIGRG